MTHDDPLPGSVGSALLAFCAGAGVLALEITAARVFVPYFGASIVVWSNVIGVTLLAVATGNFLGGRLAERWPRSRTLGGLLIAAGVLAATFPWAATALASRYLPADLPLDIAFSMLGTASLIVALATLAPPLVLVGATSPFLVRAMAADGRVGRAAGWIAGSGTLGSLFGTWLPVHWTIPSYGSKATCIYAGILLAIAGACCLRRNRAIAAAMAILIGSLCTFAYRTADRPFGRGATSGDVLVEVETPYQYARVERDGATTLLRLNEGLDSFHSMTVDDELLTGAYYDPFLLLPAMVEQRGDTLDIAILGFAAGTWGRQILAAYSDRTDLRIVGVELDPAIVELGKEHFGGLDDPRLTIHSGVDARTFLDHDQRRFELILVDTYASQVYVPFQTCSVEFFESATRHLAAEGILAANLGGVEFDDPPLRAIANTCARVFGTVAIERFEAGRNFILLARRGADPPSLSAAEDRVPATLATLAANQNAIGSTRRFQFDPALPLLTDDRSAIERLCDDDLKARARAELDASTGRPTPRSQIVHDSTSERTWSRQDREAYESARAHAEAEPNSLPALHTLAFTCFRLRRLDEATSILDAADRLDPSSSYTAFLRGVLLETRYEFDAAIAAYSAAIERTPSDAAASRARSALEARIRDVARFRRSRDRVVNDAILLVVGSILSIAAVTWWIRRAFGAT